MGNKENKRQNTHYRLVIEKENVKTTTHTLPTGVSLLELRYLNYSSKITTLSKSEYLTPQKNNSDFKSDA